MFLVFRDSYVLCIYVMNILCTFPIFMYGYVTLLNDFSYYYLTLIILFSIIHLFADCEGVTRIAI